jgi:hypothetical protein
VRVRRAVGQAVRPDIRIARPVREYRDPFGVPYEPDGQVLSYRVSACPDTAFPLAIPGGPRLLLSALSASGCRGISSRSGPSSAPAPIRPSRPAGIRKADRSCADSAARRARHRKNQHALPNALVAARVRFEPVLESRSRSRLVSR